METMCKHCDELTNKVANLEAIGSTPTKAPKKKSYIFDMPKKDVSTSCNDLCLDSSLCNQVYVEKVVVDTCTQEVAMENEQLKKEVARLTNDLTVYVYCRDRQKTLSKKGMKTQEKTMNKHYKALSHCWMEKWRLSLILKRCTVTSFLKADF